MRNHKLEKDKALNREKYKDALELRRQDSEKAAVTEALDKKYEAKMVELKARVDRSNKKRKFDKFFK